MLNSLIDTVGDAIFSPTKTTHNRTRLEQSLYDNQMKTFDEVLSFEKQKYDMEYHRKKELLHQRLCHRKVLRVKVLENEEHINALVNDLKNAQYKPNDNDIDAEIKNLIGQ